jgi:hypothetical protein|tara:strand:+ start:1491 stop:1667 length:177 start_codon:yes stop_codon:yes gene_type:complete
MSIISSKELIFGYLAGCTEGLILFKELMRGNLKSIIDKRYPLEHMAEVHKYVGKEAKR